jgi:hypothetical protein
MTERTAHGALAPAFDDVGLVKLPAAIDPRAAAAMCDAIWTFLAERDGVDRSDPVTWPRGQPTGFQALTRSDAFRPLATSSLVDALDELLEDGWTPPDRWGQPLVTFPNADAWDVPRTMWHLDFPPRGTARDGRHPLPGARILALLADLAPHGGGTLVIRGSPRVVARLVDARSGDGTSAGARDVLAQTHPFFAALCARDADADRERRLVESGVECDADRLRVVETTGAAGDVFLMHPWAFHAPSSNTGCAPRMMLSASVFARR